MNNNTNINNKKLSFKEELALVLAKYTDKIIKEGDVDPTIHFQILELFEKLIDSEISRMYRITRSLGGYLNSDRINELKNIKELLR